MRNVMVTRKFKLKLTADDWQLYGHDGDRAEERNAAAAAMNQAIEEILNTAESESDAAHGISMVLHRHRNVGAADSEGFHVMYDLLDLAYPKGSRYE